jgi:hypothetical protein
VQCVLPRTMQYVLCMLYLRAANNTCMLCLRPQRRPALPHRRRGRRRIQSAPPAARRPPEVEREQVTCFNDYAIPEDAAETVSARSARILAKCRKRPLPEGARKHISAGVCACP